MCQSNLKTLSFYDGGITESGKDEWVVFLQDGGEIEVDRHQYQCTGEELGRYATFAEAYAAHPNAFWKTNVLDIFVGAFLEDSDGLAQSGLTKEDYKTFERRPEGRRALGQLKRHLERQYAYLIGKGGRIAGGHAS